MNPKEYLSDEELLRLISLSESEGLLSAPKQLKSSILTAARAPRPLTRAEKRKQFFSYCARVGVACAACLAMLFTVKPGTMQSGQAQTAPAENTAAKLSSFSEQVDEHIQSFNQNVTDFFYNFGGTSHEQSN